MSAIKLKTPRSCPNEVNSPEYRVLFSMLAAKGWCSSGSDVESAHLLAAPAVLVLRSSSLLSSEDIIFLVS